MSNITFSYSVIFGCLLTLSQWIWADRLFQPAIEQAAPERSLLLAISRAGDRLVAAGEQGVIIYSDDEALTWQQARVPSSTLLTAVHFFGKQTGWAVGHDGVVLHTQDGGQSWVMQLDGAKVNQLRVDAVTAELQYQRSLETVDPERLENLGYQLDDAKAALDGVPSTPLLDLFFVDAQTGYAVGAYGLFLVTHDGGQHWRYKGQILPNPDSLHLNRIIKTKQGRLLILGEAGLLMQSEDKGENWQAIDLPYQGSFFSTVEADDGLYLMGLRGTVLKRSVDNEGVTVWDYVDSGLTATINDSVIIGHHAYLVGQGGALLKKQGDSFEPFLQRGLRSYSAVESVGHYLVVVGEGGVSRIDVSGGAGK
ncbi:WD40/YVTN/BNR-like repeat-containing protein [Neptuniibacter pectenicola]|uniref:WD40/YVTN/BNR-like repeat-containing protein n=1 Tax=Neptuniibacter pectenicola TaxID=1806669 RepID=UPI00079707D1|nr:YCF48-related protein [Neptuniibacter pectenicola]KXJ50664.1 MAG: hypothetical protein AXW15_05135 [Neptuniibacter sp. Phe_28]